MLPNIHWFADSNETLDRISSRGVSGVFIERHGVFQDAYPYFLQSLSPGKVLVLEVPGTSASAEYRLSLSREFHEDGSAAAAVGDGHARPTTAGIIASEGGPTTARPWESFSRQLQKALPFRNAHALLCIGRNVPSEFVVDWMKAGIFSYADASSSLDRLFQTLQLAVRSGEALREKHRRFEEMRDNWQQLNDKEIAVLQLILEGHPNKAIATRLMVSQRTVEARRQKIFQKLNTKSLPYLVRNFYEWQQLHQELYQSVGKEVDLGFKLFPMASYATSTYDASAIA
jgi:DNA-binding CsgD family transcriptional regulator